MTPAQHLLRPRALVVGLLAAVGYVLVVGIPTVLIPNPVFSREIPPTWWSWPALLVTAVLELCLLVLIVVSAIVQGKVTGTGQGATMLAYALTLPLIPPTVVFIALKEKTRWSMGVVIAGAFTVGVMAYRILQIWDLHGPA